MPDICHVRVPDPSLPETERTIWPDCHSEIPLIQESFNEMSQDDRQPCLVPAHEFLHEHTIDQFAAMPVRPVQRADHIVFGCSARRRTQPHAISGNAAEAVQQLTIVSGTAIVALMSRPSWLSIPHGPVLRLEVLGQEAVYL